MASGRSALVGMVLLVVLYGSEASAQETFERTPLLSGGWVGYDGTVFANLGTRFRHADGSLHQTTTIDLSLGLPHRLLVGGRLAPGSSTVGGRPDEWEVFGRYRPIAQETGSAIDLGITAAYNGAARSVDGEIGVARRSGPLRVLAAGRVFSDAFGGGSARASLAAGAALQPLPGRAPIALAADIATPLDREAGERWAWSAAVQLAIPYTTHTASLFASNAGTNTLQGASRGLPGTRVGLELTIPIPAGRLTGWFLSRERALAAVDVEPPAAVQAVPAEIRYYLYGPKRIVMAAGTTIEWVNGDQVVHTVSSDDASWGSGAIQPGESWRATFNEPGLYPFHCGPHPFMKGIVIVR